MNASRNEGSIGVFDDEGLMDEGVEGVLSVVPLDSGGETGWVVDDFLLVGLIFSPVSETCRLL